MKSDAPQPIFVPPHSGKVLEFLGVTHKLTSQQTGGAYYLFESVFGPGDGNRLHVHRREDEVGYVVEGALEIRLADQTVAVEAGSVAHLPKNIPHAIRNPLKTPSRYLFMTIPAGLDQWFDALEAARTNGALEDAMFRKLSLDYGIEWLEQQYEPPLAR
jgi:mannose-6-phosphate isomerase-like protein (cupin superfamily)